MEALSNNWCPTYTAGTVVLYLFSLLSDPDLEDALVPEIAALYVTGKPLYEHNAEQYTEMYATLDQSYPDCGF
jgi:ubiquitin-conjugating enzyme E2 D/E